jgi:hypothetical protein
VKVVAPGGHAGHGLVDQVATGVHAVGHKLEAAFTPPLNQAFGKVAVGAADIEERAVAGHGVQDGLALLAPALRPAAEAGTQDRVALQQVQAFQLCQPVKERLRQATDWLRALVHDQRP